MTEKIFEKFSKSKSKDLFRLATDYNSFQKFFPELYTSFRVVSSRPETTLAEAHLVLDGKEFVVMQRHQIKEPNIHEIFFVGGDAKGTYISETYEDIGTGTKITMSVDFKKGKLNLSKLISGNKFEEDYSKILDKLIKIAEN